MKLTFGITIVFMALILSGCGTFRASTSQVKHFSKSELDAMISKYEESKEVPDHIEIGEVYAMRSVCHAHHSPVFPFTRLFIQSGSDVSGIFYLVTPIALILDSCYMLPKQAIETLFVSDARISDALKDLGKARELGYRADKIAVHHLEPSSTHLDRLGYGYAKLNRKSEQKDDGPGGPNP